MLESKNPFPTILMFAGKVTYIALFGELSFLPDTNQVLRSYLENPKGSEDALMQPHNRLREDCGMQQIIH
mgnify:FL=1